MSYEEFQRVCSGYIEKAYGITDIKYQGGDGASRYIAKAPNGAVLVGYPKKMSIRVLNEVTRQASGAIWG